MELYRFGYLYLACQVNMPRQIGWLIALSTGLRFLVAAWLPLGTDETYAIAVAREFSWAFFDHPPLGFWLPVIMAKLTGLEHPLIFRLPFVILGTITTLYIWKIARLIGTERSAKYAAILFILAPYMMIGGGVFVVPDGPLNAFSILTAYALCRAVMARPCAPLSAWLMVGMWLALAMMSKYQAALIPVGTLAFLLLTHGQWRLLMQPGPWLAAAVGLLGLAPVVIWNLQHEWASFEFHTGRVGAQFQPGNFAAMTLGQFLYLLPPTIIFAAAGLWHAAKPDAPVAERLLGWLAILPIAIFMGTYIYGNSTFPHWTMPGWLFAIPLAGHWLAQRGVTRGLRLTIAGFAIAIWGLLAIVIVHVPTGLLTRWSEPIPDWDDTSEIFDYSALGPALRSMGWLDEDTLILAEDWIDAGHLSTGLGGAYPVRVLGVNKHHFQYMRGADMNKSALLLLPARLSDENRAAEATALADTAGVTLTSLGDVILQRAGRDYMTIAAYSVNW